MSNFFQYHINIAVLFALCFVAYWILVRFRVHNPLVIRSEGFQQAVMRAFPSTAQELPKFGLVRFLFGAFLLHRAFYEWIYILPSDLDSQIYIATLSVTTVFSLCIMLGFATNLALAGMVALYFGEKFLRSSTLGNDVAALLSIMLMFCASYKTYSIDNLIEQKVCKKWACFTFNSFFNLSTNAIDVQVSRAKFVAVLSYWCLCLYSAFKHFGSPTWMNGDAAIYLLTSSYLNEHYQFFRDILAYGFVEDFFRYGMFLMFPWYFIFLPSFFIRGPLLWFNIVWWFLFLILSHFVLNLSHLGHFEFLLFAALLFVPARSKSKTITFFYDGKCNLCAKTVKTIKFLDVTRRVRFVTVQSSKAELDTHGISQDVALSQLAGLYQGRIYLGYDLYALLACAMPLLWWAVPLFMVGKIGGVGKKLYKQIADNRIRLFGVCSLPQRRFLASVSIGGNQMSYLANRAATAAICLFALVFLVNPPIYPKAMQSDDVYRGMFGSYYRAGNMLGIAAIDVFNYTDLNMSTNWRVIEICPENGPLCHLVPLNGWDGERLAYHASDTLYFGGTLRWRRKNIGVDNLCDYGKDDYYSTGYINDIARLTLRKQEITSAQFKIHYFANPLPDLSQDDWPSSFLSPHKTCTVTFNVSGKGETSIVAKDYNAKKQ